MPRKARTPKGTDDSTKGEKSKSRTRKIKKIDIESGKIARTSLQIGHLKSRKSARQRPRNDPNNRAQIDRRGNQNSGEVDGEEEER